MICIARSRYVLLVIIETKDGKARVGVLKVGTLSQCKAQQRVDNDVEYPFPDEIDKVYTTIRSIEEFNKKRAELGWNSKL